MCYVCVLASYVLACILASSYPQVHVCLLVSSHPCILIFSGSCAPVGILTSLRPNIFRFIYPCLHPCILISSGWCVLACILASLRPHVLRFMCACWYPHILTSSYPQVYVCLLVCSHIQVNVFSIRMNNCILASPSSLVLGNCASQFVNNLQILRAGLAFVLDFYGTRKQPLRANLKNRLLLKSRQNL